MVLINQEVTERLFFVFTVSEWQHHKYYTYIYFCMNNLLS
jgi:hypothetical protein